MVAAAFVLFLAGGTYAFGDNDFLDLASPVLLGGGLGETASVDTPMGTIMNPAVSADRERITFDASYIALTQLNQNIALAGNIVNLGIAFPTRAGVFSAIGRFAEASFSPTVPGLQFGPLGALNLTFSKDLYPDKYVGAALDAEVGSDWGLWLDLGFLSFVGDLGIMKDFRWGGAFRNIGKTYNDGTSDSLGDPPAFTPAVGAYFALAKTKDFQLSFAPDLSFPSFQDVRFEL